MYVYIVDEYNQQNKYVINPLIAKLENLNFHPVAVESRNRNPQLQMGENYAYLFNLRPSICKFCCLNTELIPNKMI